MTMLRNELITLLGQFDNDMATVDINGLLVDIMDVHHDARRESVVLTLDPEDMRMLLPVPPEAGAMQQG
jgi:hypothetical protein